MTTDTCDHCGEELSVQVSPLQPGVPPVIFCGNTECQGDAWDTNEVPMSTTERSDETKILVRLSHGQVAVQLLTLDYDADPDIRTFLDDVEAAVEALFTDYGAGSGLPYRSLNALSKIIRTAAREYQILFHERGGSSLGANRIKLEAVPLEDHSRAVLQGDIATCQLACLAARHGVPLDEIRATARSAGVPEGIVEILFEHQA
jgi:hypothetical protein